MGESRLVVSGLHHLALKAVHPGRVAEFYRDAIGLEEVARHVDNHGLRSVWLKTETTVLMVERADTEGAIPDPHLDPPGWHLPAFSIRPQDRRHWVERLARRGCRLHAETAYSAYFLDPEGHRFALSHWPEPAPETLVG